MEAGTHCVRRRVGDHLGLVVLQDGGGGHAEAFCLALAPLVDPLEQRLELLRLFLVAPFLPGLDSPHPALLRVQNDALALLQLLLGYLRDVAAGFGQLLPQSGGLGCLRLLDAADTSGYRQHDRVARVERCRAARAQQEHVVGLAVAARRLLAAAGHEAKLHQPGQHLLDQLCAPHLLADIAIERLPHRFQRSQRVAFRSAHVHFARVAALGALECAGNQIEQLGRGKRERALRELQGLENQARYRSEIALQVAAVLLVHHAVVARAAALPGGGLAEELQDHAPAAARAVRCKQPQRVHRALRRGALIGCQVAEIEIALVPREVRFGTNHRDRSGQAVATRAPDLLVVLLDSLWRADVHDSAYVRLVDPHPEGDRGDDALRPPREEGVVGVLPALRREAGVVLLHAHAGGLQPHGEERADLLHLPPGGAVDDGRAARGAATAGGRGQLLDQRRQVVRHILAVHLAPHHDLEVGAVEGL
eukprot:COSAG04_NODE_1474_length_6580_cov_3.849869_2_plen_478_part_00